MTLLYTRNITSLVLQNPSGWLQLNSSLFKIFLIIINQLMTDKSQTFKAKLIKLQNLLTTQTVTQTTVFYIQELLGYFENADLGNEAVAKNQVYEELRDTVKAIFAYLDRIRITYNEITRNIENSIKKLLIAICKFCSAFYCYYHPVGCGEMIREFLSSQCRLFVVQIAAAVPSIEDRKQKQGERYEDYTWQWAKECGYKTIFFSRCIEVIMVNLAPFESKFEEMRVTVIGQYLRLLYYMDDYISKDRVEKLCVSHIEALEKLFRNPSKEIMKEASKESLEEVIDYAIKLLRNFKNEELKRRVNLLGVTLGMSMIKIDSIEKKIVGSKIVNKFSYEMLYKNNFHLTQQVYTQWLSKQGFFEAIFQDHCQASIVKLSDDTFKIMMKRGCISKEKFQRFFQILEKADSQLRKAMFRLIDPFRVDYYQVQAINEVFKTLRGIEFYDDEFFYFYQGISRYATQNQLYNMMAVVEEALTQYYDKFQIYLTRRRAIQCYAYIFQKLIIYKDMKDRINAYKKVAEQFLEDPSQSKIIMLKTLFNNLTESKLSMYYQEDLATEVIEELDFLRRCFPAANNPQFKEDLVYFVRGMLHRYRSNLNRKGFSKELLLEAVQFPEIFEEMLKISKESQIQGLLEQLSNLVKVKEFSFSCIKWTFIRLNQKCLKPIKKGYADVIVMYATNDNIKNFIGIDILTYLIFNSQRNNIRKGACELLAEVATNFTTQFRQQGQIYLIQYMKTIFSIISFKINEFLAGNESLTAVKGALQLVEQFLLNTEYFGVGSLKAHNSQIPTSSVWIKIYNNCLQNDDTQKIFQKKFPSNKTLFEVIAEVSNQFKLGPLDIGLQIHDFDIIKYHGLTLEELKLNGQVLNAVKLPQSRCKIEPMIVDGQLSPRAKVIFTQIFNRFAVNGYMTQNECANYIGGVTITYCPVNDNRISDLFYRYDTDKDGKITLEDFLHFYKDCILDPHRLENVEKNLYNLHYRSDLLPYNGEIDFNEEVLFRYYMWKNKQIYECLFKLSNDDDVYLSHLAQTIILRLPTYDKIISSLADTFDLKGKNSFEIEYMLTALQTHLNSQQGVGKALIQKENHLSIFEYLCILEQKKIKLQNDKNCMIICLHVLRTLLGNFNLKELNLKKPELAFQLPKTDVFISIIRESIENHDSTLLEPAFALQLTQSQLPQSLLKQSAFSPDKDTRVLTCHFLYLWLLSDKGKELNLFDIEISPINNQEWFSLLTFAIHFSAQVDFHQVFSDKLKAIASNTESLEGNRCNPIILGSLKLIKEVHYKLNVSEREQLKNCLDSLLPNLISNQNRSIVYELRGQHPEVLLEDLEKVVKIKMSKQGQPRNRFVGIKNLGCICYMNSILQQFFMIKQFYNLVMSLEAKKEVTQVNNTQIVDDFLAQLQEMYINLQLSQKQYYDPSNFCLAIKDTQGKPINTHIQEDAHQFLNSAFDKIQGYTKKEERLTELERLFGGKTVTQIICQSCKNKKEVLENYYHLSVEVKGMKSLKESFDKLIQIEEIADYFCEGCNTRVEKITKQMLIKESPEILIINLQRIIFDLETFLKVKVHTKLQFQHSLDLSSYFSSSSQPVEYKLKGVVIHTGTSEGGHYYSLIKQGDKWYKFNDQSVTLFNQADIGRQAFGGEEVTDHWGEHSSSTNAYILFYERSKQNQEEILERKHSVNKELIEKVRKENEEFARQIQFNQPSFFSALNRLVTKYAKPYSPQNKGIIERLCTIHFQVVSHLTVNSDIKTQIITQIKDNLLVLLDILPQRSFQLLNDFNLTTFKQAISNNDVNIRDIYAKIFGKSLIVACCSDDEEIFLKGLKIFGQLIECFSDEAFMKNLHKLYQFFELFKDIVTQCTKVRRRLLIDDFLAAMLQTIMGSEAIVNPCDKKKPDFHSSEAIPVISMINVLVAQKISSNNYKEIQQNLTEYQRQILNQAKFYKKMMKNKLDIGLLAPIISFMAVNNEKYSKMIAEVLLRGMNSNDQIEDKNIVFTNIRAFLLIEDELTLERKKWILGIPQMDSINDKKPQFGLMTSSESLVFTYISSLFYIRDQKYQPFLFTLFEKRKYFNSFSAYGALALLQLANESAHVRDYILTLPAPTYMQNCYFDWIQTYRNRIKIQEHYGLPIDKKILAEKLTNLLQDLRGKLISNPLYLELPVNKYIIGKNVQLTQGENYFTQQVKITLYTHQTYVLENKPYGNGNFSLPDDQFSFASTKDPITAKYFLKCTQESFEEQIEIQKKLTMLTFEITAQCPLAISFKIPSFSHKIYLKSGVHTIYTPYHDQPLMKMIEIENIQSQEKKMEQNIQHQKLPDPNYLLMEPGSTYVPLEIPPAPPMIYTDDFFQIECKVCTYLNENRHKCEMCDSDLLT